jgi:hypothetical protein
MADDPWVCAMRAGDFEAAWRINDAVLARRVADGERCTHAPRHEQFIWRGAPLKDRRVLVRCYHGLGDTLQFVRFAAPLAAVARENVFWVQPPLLDLVARVPGVQRVLALHDGTPEVDYDVDIEIMELAHALRISADSVSRYVPYLPGAGDAPSARAPGRPRVGLAWTAGGWDHSRSLQDSQIATLLRVPGIEFFSLQWPASACPGLASLPQLGCRDIAELARRVATLDLVISVDTMVAHLAGGLGRPVWTLLPSTCDWRWMAGRDDTPWYPTMKLYRQPSPGDWDSVLERVAGDLGAMAVTVPTITTALALADAQAS